MRMTYKFTYKESPYIVVPAVFFMQVAWNSDGLMVPKSKLFIPKIVAFALLHIQIYWELFSIYGQLSVYTPANTL